MRKRDSVVYNSGVCDGGVEDIWKDLQKGGHQTTEAASTPALVHVEQYLKQKTHVHTGRHCVSCVRVPMDDNVYILPEFEMNLCYVFCPFVELVSHCSHKAQSALF